MKNVWFLKGEHNDVCLLVNVASMSKIVKDTKFIHIVLLLCDKVLMECLFEPIDAYNVESWDNTFSTAVKSLIRGKVNKETSQLMP